MKQYYNLHSNGDIVVIIFDNYAAKFSFMEQMHDLSDDLPKQKEFIDYILSTHEHF